jgi:hypothetical protein
LCTTFSSGRHLQRRSTSSDTRDSLLLKDGIGREMAGQFGLRFRLSRNTQDCFTCRKSATWDRRLYFPSEGRHTVDFFARKIRPGSNPRSWVPEASMLTTKPPKPPFVGQKYLYLFLHPHYTYVPRLSPLLKFRSPNSVCMSFIFHSTCTTYFIITDFTTLIIFWLIVQNEGIA